MLRMNATPLGAEVSDQDKGASRTKRLFFSLLAVLGLMLVTGSSALATSTSFYLTTDETAAASPAGTTDASVTWNLADGSYALRSDSDGFDAEVALTAQSGLQLTAVEVAPEPAKPTSYLLFGSGLLVLGGVFRKKLALGGGRAV